MTDNAASQMLDTVFERAVERYGDPTAHMLERYYACFPEARESFRNQGQSNVAGLEAEMVQCVLYYLMEWVTEPATVRIALGGTASHHRETLGIAPALFTGLIATVHQVIAETIPAEHEEERALWDKTRDALDRICMSSWDHAIPARRYAASGCPASSRLASP